MQSMVRAGLERLSIGSAVLGAIGMVFGFAVAAEPRCGAGRTVGAAPVRVGDPGYGRHLDRDGDGVGCE